MDLQIVFTANQPSGAPAVCAMVATDMANGGTIHEATCLIPADLSPTLTRYHAITRTLDLAEQLGATDLRLKCPWQSMVDQLTIGSPLEDQSPQAQTIFEQVLGRLWQLDTWQITTDKQSPEAKLAQRMMANAQDDPQAQIISDLDTAQRRREQYTGVPQWTVELLEDPGCDCPARCQPGKKYMFGPDTPQGLCVHAAAAALAEGPLQWTDPEQKRLTTICPHCEVPIRIDKI